MGHWITYGPRNTPEHITGYESYLAYVGIDNYSLQSPKLQCSLQVLSRWRRPQRLVHFTLWLYHEAPTSSFAVCPRHLGRLYPGKESSDRKLGGRTECLVQIGLLSFWDLSLQQQHRLCCCSPGVCTSLYLILCSVKWLPRGSETPDCPYVALGLAHFWNNA